MDSATCKSELSRDGYANSESGMHARTFNDPHTNRLTLLVTAGEIMVNFEASEKTCGPGYSFS